jgi:hypothetical protein
MKMNFDEAWRFLKAMDPKVLRTKKGIPFTFSFRGESIVFRPREGQGNEKSQSMKRFSHFFNLFFVEGKRDREDFRNLIGDKSPSGTYSYFMPVFRMIEDCENEPTIDMASAGIEVPKRIETKSFRFIRDTAQSRWLKVLYNWRCQLCGTRIQLTGELWYAEAHHIRPLGRGHDGPDAANNILVVCPNHHVMLDFGSIRLDSTEIALCEGHKLGAEFIEYHNRKIYGKVC